MNRHIVIIGGGLSGALCYVLLLRHAPSTWRVSLFEREPQRLARGIAYQAEYRDQLLNVRAGNMSIYRDAPEHFVNFVAGSTPCGAGNGSDIAASFVPRATFGDYLEAEVQEATAIHAGRAALVCAEVVEVAPSGGAFSVRLGDDTKLAADAVIYAPGNSPPAHPCALGLDVLGAAGYIDYPWRQGVFKALPAERDVIFVGAGLTAVDHVVTLHRRGHRGRIIVVSRRAWWPAEHQPPGHCAWAERDLLAAGADPLTLFRALRAMASAPGTDAWTDAIDALRPYVNRIWAGWSGADRARFLRHLRPLWEVHRHRVPSAQLSILRGMEQRGQLQRIAGRVRSIASRADGRLELSLTVRRTGEPVAFIADTIVNCIGPETNWRKVKQPLVNRLLTHRLVSIDELGLGLRADCHGLALDELGRPVDGFYLIGPVRKGQLWETTALREIREQAEAIVADLVSRHADQADRADGRAA